MSIHQALSELKLLDNRIERAISSGRFIGTKKLVESKVSQTRTSVKEFNERAKADLDSVRALIERRSAIKSKIVASNATTKVIIGGTEYTVAEAIERKELQLDAIEKLRQLRNEVMTEFHERELKIKELRDNGLTSTTEFEEMIVSMSDLKRLIQMIDRDIEKLEKEL